MERKVESTHSLETLSVQLILLAPDAPGSPEDPGSPGHPVVLAGLEGPETIWIRIQKSLAGADKN